MLGQYQINKQTNKSKGGVSQTFLIRGNLSILCMYPNSNLLVNTCRHEVQKLATAQKFFKTPKSAASAKNIKVTIKISA